MEEAREEGARAGVAMEVEGSGEVAWVVGLEAAARAGARAGVRGVEARAAGARAGAVRVAAGWVE
jgi:hypothetical protein